MTKRKSKEYLGCGMYSLGEAARLLRTHPNTLRWWTGDRKQATAVIRREFPGEKVLTFSELMELHFIKMFRDEGVTLQTIRRAALEASKRFRTQHPFAVKRFDTDGKQIFATLIGRESEQEIVEELRHGQLVFATIVRPFFRKLDYGDADVERFWPMEKTGRIVLDPMRRLGEPIDSESGVAVGTIIDALQAGGGQDPATVAEWLGIPLEAVRAALAYHRSLAA
ncbi:MAG: MerR family transcriptional regulator [Planctomycetes bacterium]|nr:MerR family transcriptional regulator [Planctomycetota bacterium]